MHEWLINFPQWLRLDFTDDIDAFMRYLNIHYSDFFAIFKGFLNAFIGLVYQTISYIPWWLFIIIVMAAARRLTGRAKSAALYGVMLLAVGIFGYWEMMNETLSVVITAVFFSLLFGFPVGVFVSTARRAEACLRPVLDAMQTMPVFVYMIPAVMLMGPGKAPAVLATFVYSVVPIIRLTSHGIRQVDPEVTEAAKAFGSSRWQTLLKVQIPQAKPTIMAGVNQTMMMTVGMVVTCAMIGANGLGMEVLIAINRTESGRGIIAGVSIVIIAIIIDRLTQSMSKER
ncbi:MAG: ABC transporter permease subunit [Acidaminococcales bacterium]|jgi:ABC-type proline/glycine betaine transport system permease subunit|nr:ABC transporter permease subunit [Acidaminococcales bacterium]